MLPFIDTPRSRAADEIGRNIGEAIGGGFLRRQQEDLLTQILDQSKGNGSALEAALSDPRVLSNPQIAQRLAESARIQNERDKVNAALFDSQRKLIKDRQMQQFRENLFGNIFGDEAVPQQMSGDMQPYDGDMQNPNAAPISGGSALSRMTDNQLVNLKLIGDDSISKSVDAELTRRDKNQKRFEGDRKFSFDINKDYIKKIGTDRERLPTLELANSQLEDAILSGNTGFFSWDNFADITGIEQLRTPQGAQFLTAAKENFLSNIARGGSRPNMYLERQINQMLPKVGRSREANLTTARMLRAEEDLTKKKVEIADRLQQQEMKQNGRLPFDFQQKVQSEFVDYAKQRQSQLSYEIKKIREEASGIENLKKEATKKVPNGTPMTIQNMAVFVEKYGTPQKAAKKAKELGYTIFDLDQIREWESGS